MKKLLSIIIACAPVWLIAQSDFNCGDQLVDSRDGQTYPTTQIGNQCWMAANLNVGKQVDDCKQENNGVIEKTCYNNAAENCEKLGGLYTFFESLQWVDEESVQGVCPDGWHVPSINEWNTLINYLGVDSAGQKIKSSKNDSPKWDGTNETGFSAIPSGTGNKDSYGRLGHRGYFWSSTANTNEWAWSVQLDGYWYPIPPKYMILHPDYYFQKDNAFSIRCLKD